MNVHDATELAYKNGYRRGVENTVQKMVEEIKKRCIEGGIYPAFVARTIDEIANEILEDL